MSTSRPTVVHVATVDMSLELLLGSQLEAIAAAGFRVIGASAPGPHVDALMRRGIEHVPLAHATRAMAPIEDARAFAELVRLFRRLGPAIVHTHTPKPGIYGRIAARLDRVPVVVNTVHGLYALPHDHWHKRAAVYGIERLAATCSQAEIVVSPEDMRTLRRLRVPADRLVPLDAGLGIDLARFDPGVVSAADRAAARRELGASADGDVVLGLVGRLVREKGYPEVFDAVGRLRSRFPHLRVAVIGPDEPDKPDALTPADRAAAERSGVSFLGHRDDVARLYSGMDIFVLASHREGFPRTPMEASAMGVPVVASDIRGCRSVVDDGLTGLLVPPRDPGALADAIAQLVPDPTTRRRLGTAARHKAVERFDEGRCIQVTLATYGQLLARAGVPVPAAARPDVHKPRVGGGRTVPQPSPSSSVVVRAASPGDAGAVADLHADRIAEGFLVTLGPRFLTRLYRRIARSPHATLLVAESGEQIVGFVATATSTRRLYVDFVLHDAVPAGLAAAPAALRAPRRVWETFHYGASETGPGRNGDSTNGDGDLPAAEVLSIAVATDAGGRGIGGALLAGALEELSRAGVTEARVVTAVGNDAALAMYERAGFRRRTQTEVHAGVPQEVLVWP
jgi:glycosyltransferase involved in cell wall biosynthesis/ribosomal protein S18 acetylase RimI-like enzyme